MLAVQKTSGGLFRRFARTMGAVAIGSGIAVTGVAASASAETVIPLHTATSTDNPASGTGSCDDVANSQTSYWHFIVSDNKLTFTGFSLNVGDATPLLVPAGQFTSDGSGKGSHAYVAVPNGKSLTSLQKSGSSATVSQDVDAETINFNLSHTCAGVTPPVDVCTNIDEAQTTAPAGYSVDGTTCTPPPMDVCNNVDGNQPAIPSGQISNGSGGCVTALVSSDAPAPSQIDLCSNIGGDQLEVPTGYALTNGSCELVASEAVLPADVTLPVTGSNTMSGIAIGLAMVGAGLILSALARRRSARHSA